MQEIKKYMLAVLLVFLGYMVYGQNPRTASLRWSSSQFVELRSNTTQQAAFEIETHADGIRITTGNLTKVFTITSASGQWSDVTTDGTLIYDLTFGQKEGSAILKRENGSWEFTLDFSTYLDGIRQKFLLSGFQQIP